MYTPLLEGQTDKVENRSTVVRGWEEGDRREVVVAVKGDTRGPETLCVHTA